jgi:hypothetical protein
MLLSEFQEILGKKLSYLNFEEVENTKWDKELPGV